MPADEAQVLRRTLSVLRGAETENFAQVSRDETYGALGIERAGQIARMSLDGLAHSEKEEIRRLIIALGLSKLPPIYPADQKFAAFFENADLPSVSELRSKLGYPHYHTRDSILADLRGFVFNAILEHFDSYRNGHPDGEGFGQSFLSQVAARHVNDWRARIRRVLSYSRYEDWDDATVARFADDVIEDVLHWFLSNPQEFLLSPQEAAAWSGSLWSTRQASLATRFFAGVFGHLAVLRESQLDRNLSGEAVGTSRKVDGGAGPVDSSGRFLVESSWYRHFFFDERGIARWIRFGAAGFEREETFDDFLTKLEAHIGWKEIVSPNGDSLRSPEEVRVARLLGPYRVKLNGGEVQEVLVKPIPTLDYDELAQLVESRDASQDAIPLGKRLWLFRVNAVTEPPPRVLVVRALGRDWSDLVWPYFFGHTVVGVVRVPGAGRYPISLPDSREALFEIVERQESASLEEPLFDVSRGVLIVNAKADIALTETPRPDQLAIRLRFSGGEVVSKWESSLEEATVGLYRLDARFELPLTPALLGGSLTLEPGLVKKELRTEVPSFAILSGSPKAARALGRVAIVSAAGAADVVVLGKPPFDVCLPDGSVIASVSDGLVATTRLEGTTVTMTNRGVITEITILDSGEALLTELAFRSGNRLIRLVRRREIRVLISPVLGGEGVQWVAVAGSALVLRLDVVPPTKKTMQVVLRRPDGTREAFEISSGSELQIPEAFRLPGLTLISVQGTNLAPIEAELVCVGEPRVESPSLMEAGHIDAVMRITCDTPFSVRWISGTVSRWITQPRQWRPTKEALIVVSPYRTPDAMCRVDVEYNHAGRTLMKDMRTVSVAVPLVWVEVQHRGARVSPDGIQGFRGEPILAVLRTAALNIRAWAEYAGTRVGISRLGRSSTDLTSALGIRGLDDPIEVGFIVLEDGKPERALAQKVRVTPHYVPRISVPDGLSWHPTVPYAVIVESPRPGQDIELVGGSGATVGVFTLIDGVASVTCPQLPAELCLRGGGGERIVFDYQGERRSVPIGPKDAAVRIRILASDEYGRFNEIDQWSGQDLAPERVFAEAEHHRTLCIEVPSLLAALPLMRAVMAAGWRVNTSEPLDRLRDIPLGDPQPSKVSPAEDMHRLGGPPGVFILLGYDDAPSWESFLTGGASARAIVVAPAGTFETRLSQSTAVEQLGAAFRSGKLLNPHDMTAWVHAVGVAQASALGQAAMQVGLEDVLVDSTVAALSESPEPLLLDANACENINRIISYPGLLSRVATVRQAALRAALLSLGRRLLSSDPEFYRKASKGFEILIRGWDSSATADPRSDLVTEERSKTFRLIRGKKFGEAIDVMRRIFQIFMDDGRLQWELPAIVVNARMQGSATNEDYRTAVRTLVTLDRERIPGREATLYRREIQMVLGQPRCLECGGLISTVARECMWCRRPYTKALNVSGADAE